MSAKSMLFGSESLYRLVLFFVVHPDAAPHFRALQRRLGGGTRPLRAALERLEEHGLIRSEGEMNRRVYRANEDHEGWEALRHMVRAFADPAEVLRESISDVPGIEAAFLFGSMARGEPHADSDVDVLVLGDEIPRRALGKSTSELSALLGREVNVVRYTRGDFSRRLSEGNAFIQNVISGPKQWIIGDPRVLPSVSDSSLLTSDDHPERG